MVEDAVAWDLLVLPKPYAAALAVEREFAHGRIHDMGRTWALLGYRRRTLPDDAVVHASVQDRVTRDPAYASRLPARHRWDDPQWFERRGPEGPSGKTPK